MHGIREKKKYCFGKCVTIYGRKSKGIHTHTLSKATEKQLEQMAI